MVSKPHGGKLIRRIKRDFEKEDIQTLEVSLEQALDIENICRGVFSPLEGFLDRNNYLSVLENKRLSNDIPWTIPIILDVSNQSIDGLKEGDDVLLKYYDRNIALMNIEEIYQWDKKQYARYIYGTTDPEHPGVSKIYKMNDYLVAGKLELLNSVPTRFERYTLWPIETRILFRERGWRTIVGFQTRNAPHRGHEYVQKAALTFVDGLFVNPLVGWKKKGDYKDDVILAAYETLIKHYYPRDVVVLAVLRTSMRYAGPREAVHHAIMRKNFGCTHFIIGRDHAGVGNYYGPYDAWKIFQEFPDLGITPLFIREAFYCKKCDGMVNEKICPHNEEYRIHISGTNIRRMLLNGERPPEYMMRREVAETILSFENPFM
ncbi:MAG: sulfate adenylyltransferase [Thermoproteales archaeon]|nr:sulfate adenylyltransferase [Thermoproteales archaeon]